MTAWFIVRARLRDAAVAQDFDRWYRDEHLPDAVKAFNAQRAWRGWSTVDASVHYAYCQFDDIERARAIPGSDALKRLIAEFDRVWGDKVSRSRDLVEIVQALGP